MVELGTPASLESGRDDEKIVNKYTRTEDGNNYLLLLRVAKGKGGVHNHVVNDYTSNRRIAACTL